MREQHSASVRLIGKQTSVLARPPKVGIYCAILVIDLAIEQ